jgi:hypothetical protein
MQEKVEKGPPNNEILEVIIVLYNLIGWSFIVIFIVMTKQG